MDCLSPSAFKRVSYRLNTLRVAQGRQEQERFPARCGLPPGTYCPNPYGFLGQGFVERPMMPSGRALGREYCH